MVPVIVSVEWVDSMVEPDWQSLDDLRRKSEDANALNNVTVGHLLLDEPGYVLIASTATPGVDGGKPTYGNTTQIPRCAIVAVRSMTVGRKRR
jgi:hypothetical protein